MRFSLVALVAVFSLSGLAQVEVAPPTVRPAEVTPPATEPAPGPTPAPLAPVLENTGKPIAIPFQCTGEDIQLAGLTCTADDPCPVYIELNAVESVGSRIFLAGNLHSPAVTMFSALLGTDDGGRTWREVHERIRSAALDRIQFVDAENGWAAGETLSPLPQDPFLLHTSDGGKTWRQRFVFRENAEDRMGMIQQFFFTAADSGSLIVDRGQGGATDRYELYESSDGGETWAFERSSKQPLRLRQTAPDSGAWRLRADRATQAFEVERHQGGGWAPVASFLVKAGSCQP